MLGHPYNSLCFSGDARWSEVLAEFRAMRIEVSCELSSVVVAFLHTRLGALQEDIGAAALSEHFELGKDVITFYKKGVPYRIVRSTMNSTRRNPTAMYKEGMFPDLFAMFCCDLAWASVFHNLLVQLESSSVYKNDHAMELSLSEVDGSCTSLPIARRSITTRKATIRPEEEKTMLEQLTATSREPNRGK